MPLLFKVIFMDNEIFFMVMDVMYVWNILLISYFNDWDMNLHESYNLL